eukprot:2194931-Rhodomonas_salina.2
METAKPLFWGMHPSRIRTVSIILFQATRDQAPPGSASAISISPRFLSHELYRATRTQYPSGPLLTTHRDRARSILEKAPVLNCSVRNSGRKDRLSFDTHTGPMSRLRAQYHDRDVRGTNTVA